MKTQNSKVTTIANRLITQGYHRSNAMLKAWALVKLPLVEAKVAGVTQGKRQLALEHLARYTPEQISITLVREFANPFDSNEVAVIASVCGKGSYNMGHLPRALSAFIAPLMDTGKQVCCCYNRIRGLYAPYMNYGLVINIWV